MLLLQAGAPSRCRLNQQLTCLGEEWQGCLKDPDRSPEVCLKHKLHLPHVRVRTVTCMSNPGSACLLLRCLVAVDVWYETVLS